MVYFQLCLKTFRPLFNDNPQVPSGGGVREKVTQVLLRQKVMLCYDTNRFLSSCMFFEIFRWQNLNFMVKNEKKTLHFLA